MSDYSKIEEWLHHATIGSPKISRFFFELEKRQFAPQLSEYQPKKMVFVSGLARSGTTALLNYLHDVGVYESFSYRNMPLVFNPNFWKLEGKANQKKIRAHGDTIWVNNESIEAFDEAFWVAFHPEFYSKPTLPIQNISPKTYRDYLSWIQLLLLSKNSTQKNYLAKNNNLLLRFQSLTQIAENVQAIFCIRKPLAHAESLLRQHLRFCDMQQKDPFALKYMNWLGHFEFGLNQKPFDFGNTEINQLLHSYPKNNINYWLASWLNYYTYLQTVENEQTLSVSYENLCHNPQKICSDILDFLKLPNELPSLASHEPSPFSVAQSAVDKALYERCRELYQKLVTPIEMV